MPRPARPPLTRERILQAALALIDEHGLEWLSMRKLAAELGVEAMSLYNHVPGKGALLDGVTELLLSRLDVPLGGELDWKERVRVGARSLRALARQHPCLVPLLTTRQVRTPTALRTAHGLLEALRHAGFDEERAAYACRTLLGYLFGFLLQELGGLDQAGCPERGGAGEPEPLRALADVDHDRLYDFGLDVILTGLERLLAERPAAAPG